MTDIDDSTATQSKKTWTGRSLRRALPGILVTCCIAWLYSRYFEKPVMPRMATGHEVPVVNPAGFSMAFPRDWNASAHPLPSGFNALTAGRPKRRTGKQRTERTPAMSAGTWYLRARGPARESFHPHQTTFQGRATTLRAGRFTQTEPLLRNLKRVWQGRSFGRWKPSRTSAHWYLEFEQAGKTVCLYYSAPCGSCAQIDPTTVPPEVMSYFATFQYNAASTTTTSHLHLDIGTQRSTN